MSADDDKTRIASDAASTGPGTQLSGIYELDERIAFGGMGEVWRGHNIQTGDHVAIKIVLPELARDQTILSLFRKEASILNHLSHDAIVRYHVFTVDSGIGRPYLAMEYVDGESLFDVMRHGPMPAGEAYRLCHRLASGLSAVHRAGAIHRDLSPDNVIVPDGQVDRAKIIDFGIARSAKIGGETLIGGKFAGKYNYVSPEQLGLYGGEVTAQSDIYSLGLVLAAALRGKPIDMNGSQAEIVEKRRVVPDLTGIDESLQPIIEAMLQPDPNERLTSMSELAKLTPVEMPEELEETIAPRSAALRERLASSGSIPPGSRPPGSKPPSLPKAGSIPPWSVEGSSPPASLAGSVPPLAGAGAAEPSHPPPSSSPLFVQHERPAHLDKSRPASPPPAQALPRSVPRRSVAPMAVGLVALLVFVAAGGAYLSGYFQSAPEQQSADSDNPPPLRPEPAVQPPVQPEAAKQQTQVAKADAAGQPSAAQPPATPDEQTAKQIQPAATALDETAKPVAAPPKQVEAKVGQQTGQTAQPPAPPAEAAKPAPAMQPTIEAPKPVVPEVAQLTAEAAPVPTPRPESVKLQPAAQPSTPSAGTQGSSAEADSFKPPAQTDKQVAAAQPVAEPLKPFPEPPPKTVAESPKPAVTDAGPTPKVVAPPPLPSANVAQSAEGAENAAKALAGTQLVDAGKTAEAEVPSAAGVGGVAEPVAANAGKAAETNVAMNVPKPNVPKPVAVAPDTSPLGDAAQRVSWLASYRGGNCFYATATAATADAMNIEGFGTAVGPFDSLLSAFQEKFRFDPDVSVRLIEPSQCEITSFLRVLGDTAAEKPKLTLDRTSIPDGAPITGSLETHGGLISNVLLIDHKGMTFNLDDRVTVQYGRADFSIPIGLSDADKQADSAVPLVMLVITGPQAIHAADFSTPLPVDVALPRILDEIKGKESRFSATAKYFRLGG